MAATVQARVYTTGTEGTGANAETGMKFNREDTQSGTAPIPVPTASGTNYSWLKNLALYVTAGGGSTTLADRKVRFASALTTGLTLHFKDGGGTYAQATSGNKPTDNATTNDATPATFTLMSTAMQAYDAAGEAATNSDRNGNFCIVILGASNLYVAGGGSAIAVSNVELEYSES